MGRHFGSSRNGVWGTSVDLELVLMRRYYVGEGGLVSTLTKHPISLNEGALGLSSKNPDVAD